MCGKYECNYKRKHFCIVRIRHRTKGDKILGILPRDLLDFCFGQPANRSANGKR